MTKAPTAMPTAKPTNPPIDPIRLRPKEPAKDKGKKELHPDDDPTSPLEALKTHGGIHIVTSHWKESRTWLTGQSAFSYSVCERQPNLNARRSRKN